MNNAIGIVLMLRLAAYGSLFGLGVVMGLSVDGWRRAALRRWGGVGRLPWWV